MLTSLEATTNNPTRQQQLSVCLSPPPSNTTRPCSSVLASCHLAPEHLPPSGASSPRPTPSNCLRLSVARCLSGGSTYILPFTEHHLFLFFCKCLSLSLPRSLSPAVPPSTPPSCSSFQHIIVSSLQSYLPHSLGIVCVSLLPQEAQRTEGGRRREEEEEEE